MLHWQFWVPLYHIQYYICKTRGHRFQPHQINKNKEYNKKNVEIWGSGKPSRELIYVDDVAKAIIKFMFNRTLINKKIYWINIGTGMDKKIDAIVKKIAKIIDYKGKLVYNLEKPDGVKSKLMNINLSKKFGWPAKINLNHVLKKTIHWYKINK